MPKVVSPHELEQIVGLVAQHPGGIDVDRLAQGPTRCHTGCSGEKRSVALCRTGAGGIPDPARGQRHPLRLAPAGIRRMAEKECRAWLSGSALITSRTTAKE